MRAVTPSRGPTIQDGISFVSASIASQVQQSPAKGFFAAISGVTFFAKAKNVTPEIAAKNPFAGDCWTWLAIDADTKLIPSWIVGPRDGVTARIFVNDLAGRLANRIQLTSDGLHAYLQAVERAFHGHVDYAQIHKIY